MLEVDRGGKGELSEDVSEHLRGEAPNNRDKFLHRVVTNKVTFDFNVLRP